MPPIQNITLTPPQTVSGFALTTGAIAVQVATTVPQAVPATAGAQPTTFSLGVTPSWQTTWWISGVTTSTWTVNFAVPAPSGGTVTITAYKTNTVLATQGGWSGTIPTPPPTPPITQTCNYGVYSAMGFFSGSQYATNLGTNTTTLGVKLVRVAVQWYDIQSSAGAALNLTYYAELVSAIIGAGATPLLTFGGAPSWANGNITPAGDWNVPVPGTAFTTFANYYASAFGQLVAYFGTKCIYEVWNEPNQNYVGSFWLPGGSSTATPSIASYAQLATGAYTAGKAANPAALIGMGSGTNMTYNDGNATCTPGITWAIDLLTTYAVPCDAVTCHPYSAGGSANPATDNYPTGNSFKDVPRMQAAMVAAGFGNKQLWLTEWGSWSAAGVGGESVKAGYCTAALDLIEANWSVHVVGTAAAGVTYSALYQMNDATSGTTDNGLFSGPQQGPNTILASGTAVQVFMATSPT